MKRKVPCRASERAWVIRLCKRGHKLFVKLAEWERVRYERYMDMESLYYRRAAGRRGW